MSRAEDGDENEERGAGGHRDVEREVLAVEAEGAPRLVEDRDQHEQSDHQNVDPVRREKHQPVHCCCGGSIDPVSTNM